ncbi:hypothetical protein [Actinoplanes sp. NPDC049265]|uniref:hypothetical protein n=1 Tax=Actinoplanes sp. NPDC049265 TaxID=3363902 RepID=UPI003721579C
MTGQASDDTLAATADRIVQGLGQVGSTLAGFVARATEEAAPAAEHSPGGSAGPPGDETAGDARGPAPADGGDPWARATAGSAPAGEGDARVTAGSAPAGEGDARATAGSAPAGEGDARATAGSAPAGEGDARATAGSAPADEGDPWAWATGAVRRVVGLAGEDRAGTHVSYGWSTGSVECCVCPVCRMIATMRNPTPEAAERLATGAGDFATGVVSLMRAFSAMSGSRPKTARRPATTPPPPPDPDLAWSAATRRGSGPVDVPVPPDEDQSPWTAATRAANREAAGREAAAKAERDRATREAVARQREEAVKRREEAARRGEEAARRREEADRAATGQGAGQPLPGPEDSGTGAAGGGGTGAASGGGRRDEAANLWGWGGGDRAGDVWARATADPGVGSASTGSTVDHDDAGDAAHE